MSLLAWAATIEKLVQSNKLRIVLASASPRRKELLGYLLMSDKVFVTETSGFEENLPKDRYASAGDYALGTAIGKAKDVAARAPSSSGCVTLVIGADTVVDFKNEIVEKPIDAQDARKILRELSGNTHFVVTGLIVLSKTGEEIREACSLITSTKVKFTDLSDEAIAAYVETKEPMDKSGAYGIQGLGRSLVEAIEGDFYNAVGFPSYDFGEHFAKILAEHFPDEAPAKQTRPTPSKKARFGRSG